MNLTKQTNGWQMPYFLRAGESDFSLPGVLPAVANKFLSALKRSWMCGWGLSLLVVLTLLAFAHGLKAQTTESFTTSPTLISHPSVPSWKTSAEVTIGGVVYELLNGGNGGWAFSGSGGVSNSSSLFYSTAATSSITIKRKDGARFQFYGVWLKYKNFTSGYTAPWLTANYNGSGASSDTYGSNTTVSISKNLNVTTVTLMFSGLWELNFDNLIVGPAIASLPTVTTTAADLIGGTYASLGGNVTSDGGGTITDRGIVYSTSPSPAIGDGRGEQVAIGTGSGVFSQTVAGFSLSTTYYVRAYAINSAGTSYGSQITFTTTDGTGPITLVPSMDTYIESGSGYSTSQTNYVGDWWGWYSDAAIKFNLAAVTGTVSDAKLRLYVSEVGSGTVFAKVWGSDDDSWLATTNAVPSKNTSLSSNVSITATGWKEFDVTAFIKQQAEGDGTASLVIAGNTAEGDNWFGFKSDNSATNKPQLVVTVAAGNTAPAASSVAISGAAEVGVTLTGTYSYADANSDAESGTTYKWYRGVADVGVAPVAITGATQATYLLQSEDEGKYITFEVTPSDGTDAGSAMVSERLGPVVQTVLLATSPIISFSNEVGFEDNIAQDGEGGSVVISDLNLQVMPVNSSGVKLAGQPIQYHDNTQSGWSGYPAIITYGDIDAHFGWSIKSDNGTAFSLVAVDFHDWGGYAGDTFVAEAFLDAASKGTITFTGNVDGSYIALTNSGVLSSIFANVDEVRIYKQGGSNSWGSLNNIQVASAVLTGPPTVSTAAYTDLATTSATLGGNVTASGGLDVIERGIVYATTAEPTIANTKVEIGSGTGTFSQSVTGLEVNTTYYFRAYAINSLGTSYGSELSFITPKIAQTISFDAISAKVWGDEPFTLGAERTDQDLVITYAATDPSVVTIVGNQATIKKAGSTTITASQAGDDTYAAALSVEQTLTVNKKTLTVTAEDKTKEYGAADPVNTVTYAGFISGEGATDLGGTLSFSRTAGEDAGNYAITPGGLTSNNYTISFVAGDLEITKKALTITAEDKTKEFGTADPVYTAAYAGFVTGDDATDLVGTLSFNRTAGEVVATYTITPSGVTSANYAISFVGGELEITKKVLTVTAENKTKEYGEVDPANTVTYSGFTTGEDETDLGGTLSFSRTSGEGAGTYAITPAGLTSDNYAISFVAGDLKITKRALTVTAEDKTKEYGVADPVNTVTYAGFITGESATDLSGTLSFSRTAGEDAGNYAITPGGLTSNNYTISFVAGDLEITKKALTITAEDKAKEFGASDPVYTAAYAGFVTGDDATDLIGTLSFNRTAGEVVATYTITPSGVTSANYAISFVGGELEITKKVLTVTAENKTKEYGEVDPANTVTYSGFTTGEDETDLGGTLSFSRTSGEGAGTYAITPAGLTSDNYAISFVAGDLEITKRALTVTAEDKTKEYGVADPVNTVTYAGFITGESATDLSGTLSFSRTAGEDAGNYAITPAGLTSNNYTISFVAGDLEITKKALTITAEDKTKEFGASDPVYTAAYAGFVTGDDATDLSGTLSFNRTAGEVVATYTITPSGVTSANYAISFVGGELEITKKVLTVTAENKTKEYGEVDPANTVTYSGFTTGEDETDLGGTLSFSRTSGEGAGTYAITPAGLTSDNYAISFVAGDLEITKRALTVTAEDKTKEYGVADPVNTVTYAGFITGESATDLSGTLSFSRTAGEDAGNYAITPAGLTSNNYTISFVAGDLEITKKALTITAEDKTKEYGETDPTATVAYSGLVEGDEESDFDGMLAFTRATGENPGVYTISPSGLTSDNYTISFADGELQITPRQLTVHEPVLTKAKLHDGLKTAEVLAGALVGVVDGDVVELTAEATYDDASTGVDKTITVTYTIAGADAFKYLAPTDFVVTNGEIIVDVEPVFTSVGSPSVKENETNVLVVTATDGNEGTTITYSLSGGWDMALFSIDATTGALTFKTAPDFEQPTDADGDNVYLVQVTATDGVNVTNQTIEITITNENDSAPVVLAAQSFQVAETVNSGTLVGKVMAHDSDEGTELQGWIIVSGNEEGIFDLSPASGDLVVVNSATLAMQTATSYTLVLTVSDGIHVSIETEITVLVSRGQQASLAAEADSYEINEDEVLTVDAPGVLNNDGNVLTAGLQLVLVGDVSHGSLVLNANGSFVYTPDANFNGADVFSYKVVEGEIASETVSVTVEVLPVNDAPHAIIFNNVNVAEDAAPGFKAAEFGTEDIDSDSHTYELVDGEGAIDNESFIIEGNKLLTNVRFDIDEITLLSVRVRTTDPAGAYLEKVFGVQIVPGFHPDLVIPTAFTPNNDNVNDSWEFENAHFYRNMSVNVYNRQGRLVFSSVGYRQPWTGQRSGVSLPLDMYYYVIDLNDGSGRGYKSYVMILQ
ncbi:MBG domain-containing protein [Imperialibacter roseus]|uniref:MBG domain-containing protein n=1 Tax=Imperialibacter roseus TaxID=1324217 RepID=A0ABZ0IX74_9BACT|nr:MBG domain-containing protein [Imperialibacter roseus]WOK08227.1 MBG domain-containing protein [Imperialibacter roseus]